MFTITFEDRTHTNLLFSTNEKVKDVLIKVCKKRVLNEKQHHLEKVDGTLLHEDTPLTLLSKELHILIKSNTINKESFLDLDEDFLDLSIEIEKHGRASYVDLDDDFFYDTETGNISSKITEKIPIPKESKTEELPNTERTSTRSQKEEFIVNNEILKINEIPKVIKCKRDNIIYELLSTEQTYVRGLNILKEVKKNSYKKILEYKILEISKFFLNDHSNFFFTVLLQTIIVFLHKK